MAMNLPPLYAAPPPPLTRGLFLAEPRRPESDTRLTARGSVGSMARKDKPGTARVALRLALYLLLGVPMFGFIWWNINEILSLSFDPLRILLTGVVGAIFLLLLRSLSRSIARWEMEREEHAHGDGSEVSP